MLVSSLAGLVCCWSNLVLVRGVCRSVQSRRCCHHTADPTTKPISLPTSLSAPVGTATLLHESSPLSLLLLLSGLPRSACPTHFSPLHALPHLQQLCLRPLVSSPADYCGPTTTRCPAVLYTIHSCLPRHQPKATNARFQHLRGLASSSNSTQAQSSTTCACSCVRFFRYEQRCCHCGLRQPT